MRTTSFFLLLTISKIGASTTVEGTLITQIKGITDNITIRSSSNPDVAQRPRPDGSYSVLVASPATDYLLIIPGTGDDNLYSPRIIRAAEAGTDTLYIIPPTNQPLSIIIDNKTGRDLKFIADKAVVLDELVTSAKDYQLTIVSRPQQSHLLIAAFTAGFPAVVRKVAIMPDQNRGYLVIDRQDIGLAPLPAASSIPPYAERTGGRSAAPAPPAPPQDTPTTRTSDRSGESDRAEELYVPVPTQTGVRPPITRERDQKEQSASTGASQSAYYFSDRLILKDKLNGSLGIRGDYQTFAQQAEEVQLTHYGVAFYNLRLLRNYFDISMQAINSQQLPDVYYRGSIVWHRSPYAAIDLSYKSAANDIWHSRYDAARMSLGVNGCYKSQGERFQMGAGVRFQLDYGDFGDHLDDATAGQFRYLPSVYLIAFKSIGRTTASVMAGMINEAAYASFAVLIARHIGVTYAFKDASFGSTPLTPLEKERTHKMTLEIDLTLKKRQ
ncbi:hypothetical protein JW998_10810 [candidate division KSB1 bacterium]|nr:hypothetical protein [candidate division KSB1 bacterium]